MGYPAVFLALVLTLMSIIAWVVAILASRVTRRATPGVPIATLAAEQLARRAARTGVTTLATALATMSCAFAIHHEVIGVLLGIVAVYGALERVSASCVLRRLAQPEAIAELRGTTLLVTSPYGRTWLEVTQRAIRATSSLAQARAQNL
jgi:hypothetical protein